MADWWRTKEWERRRPWAAGLANGAIIGVAFFLIFVSDGSVSRASLIAGSAAVIVAIVRAALLTRENNKQKS